ncbi:Predicted phosphoribosyltransferase [Hoeflea sp. EC-HK425]|nr:Predicted phosphoribosyltransferase [Hoeflea sp. EC-HK425]
MPVNGYAIQYAILPRLMLDFTRGEKAMFADRNDAGQKLARELARQLSGFDHKMALVVALPRGGVPVAEQVAEALDLPLDILLVRKVGAPGYPEVAIGAISDGEKMQLTINREVCDQLGLDDEEVRDLAQEVLPELERRKRLYCGDRPTLAVKGRPVIVVDDGAATGATLRIALRVLRERGATRLIVALPVAPVDVVEKLHALAEDVICLEIPSSFRAVGAHYRDFRQVDDQEVVRILEQANGACDHRLH